MTKMKKLTHPNQIPRHMSEKEEAEFWSTHELTKEFLDQCEVTSPDRLPFSDKGKEGLPSCDKRREVVEEG